MPGRAVPVPVGRPLPGRPEQAPAAPRAPRAGALAAGRRLWAGRWCPLSSAPLHRKEKNRSSQAHPLSHTEGSGIFSPSLISSPVRLASEQGSVTRSTQPLQGGVCLSSPPTPRLFIYYPLATVSKSKGEGWGLEGDPDHAQGTRDGEMCRAASQARFRYSNKHTYIYTHIYMHIYVYKKVLHRDKSPVRIKALRLQFSGQDEAK